MELIQWDKCVGANLTGGTNGNVNLLFGFLDTDNIDPLMEMPHSLEAFTYFSEHCISARLVSGRNIYTNVVNDFVDLIYADTGRLFHQRGSQDTNTANVFDVIPVKMSVVGVTESEWQSNGIPCYVPALFYGKNRTVKIVVKGTAQFEFYFAQAIDITSIQYAHASTSAVANRPTGLRVEALIAGVWQNIQNLTTPTNTVAVQIFSSAIVLCTALRISCTGTAPAAWHFDQLSFTTNTCVETVETPSQLLMSPLNIAGHPQPPTWANYSPALFAYGMEEVVTNIDQTDRFQELVAVSARIEIGAVLL